MTISLRRILLPIFLSLGINLQAQQVIQSDNLPKDTIGSRSLTDAAVSSLEDKSKLVSFVKIDLSKVKFTNELSLLEFLQGRVSGLDISNESTDPGISAQAVLRGQNFTGNRIPLIVIDGIPQESLGNIFNAEYNYNEKIQHLIPVSLADIASVEVLKDGISTAFYGAEGANGVILIQTKKGNKQKLSLTYEFNQSIINRPSSMSMLNSDEYINYQLEAWHNSYGAVNIPAEFSMKKGDKDYYNYTANTDWMKAVTQAGNATNHFMSLTGGNEKNRLYASINYQDQTGTTINTGIMQVLNRLNYEHFFSKKFNLAINFNYRYGKNDGNTEDILNMAFQRAPNLSIWKNDAVGVPHGDYFIPSDPYNNAYFGYSPNPVGISETSHSVDELNDLITTARVQYRIFNWLQGTETFSYNKVSSDIDVNNPFYIDGTEYEQLRNEMQVIAKAPFKNQRLNSLSGIFTFVAQDENISKEITTKLDKSNTSTSKEPYDRYRKAWISSVNYKLYDRYIIIANARLESNSLIYDSERWDRFYGASLAWRFSEEPFLKNLKLNQGQIYLGWSDMEYQPDPGFLAYGYFSNKHPYRDPIFGSGYNNPYAGTSFILQNPSYEAGLELAMFKNRLQISGDYYNKKPESITTTNYRSSSLKLENKGWEGTIDYTIVSRKNLSWSLQFNIAHNSQTLVKMTNIKDIKQGLGIYNKEGYSSYIWEGKSMGSIYGFIQEGIYASDEDAVARDREGNIYYNNGRPVMMFYYNSFPFKGGDSKYKDINYDGIINDNDLVYLGNTIPDFTGGFGSTIHYRNLTLTCNFHYRTGYKLINQTAYFAEGRNSKNNMSKKVLNHWRVQGQQAPDLMPKAYLNRSSNYMPSDLYVESGSFARLNYLNLGYSFGSTVCQKLHVKELSFSLSGQRLYTYTNYSGLNPETEISNNYLTGMNIDDSKVSPPKVYTLSLRITI